MKRSTLILLIVAASLTAAGLILGLVSVGMIGADMKSFLGELDGGFESNTHNIFVSVSGIDIEAAYSDIYFAPSPDEYIRVTAMENQKQYYDVAVENDTLVIKYRDIRLWYERVGINLSLENDLTVYLPEGTYKELCISCASGDINIPSLYSFDNVTLDTASGDIDFRAGVSGSLDISSSSGEIDITDVQSEAAKLNISSASGDVETEGCEFSEINIKTSSGSIELYMCDAGRLELSSASGDIEATLMSHKVFFADSAIGNVRVPASVPDSAECHLSTSSGDITVTVQN